MKITKLEIIQYSMHVNAIQEISKPTHLVAVLSRYAHSSGHDLARVGEVALRAPHHNLCGGEGFVGVTMSEWQMWKCAR